MSRVPFSVYDVVLILDQLSITLTARRLHSSRVSLSSVIFVTLFFLCSSFCLCLILCSSFLSLYYNPSLSSHLLLIVSSELFFVLLPFCVVLVWFRSILNDLVVPLALALFAGGSCKI